jgi:hypothetical protein
VLSIAHGNVELDPIMVWIFGTNKPNATKVYGCGVGVIALEILAAFVLTYLLHPIGYVFVVGGIVQSTTHIRAAIGNFKIS